MTIENKVDVPDVPDVPKKAKHPVPSRIAAVVGIVSDFLMAISIIGRLIGGTGRLGLTGYGERLYQQGLPYSVASALDFGDASELMLLAMVLGLIAVLLGLIAVFRKGRKKLAITGIVTGLCVVAPPLLLPLL
jgi:vacuolar-type H+-ATPase subunit I/STV1